MADFGWDFGLVNIQGSFNKFFQINVTGAELPAYLTGVTSYFDFPEQGLTAFPAFTITHMGGMDRAIAEGNIVMGGQTGRRYIGQVDISCWASTRLSGGGRNNSATIQVRSMRDMVKYLMLSAQKFGIRITDVYAGTAVTGDLSALIRISTIDEAPMVPDNNPSIRRIRMLAGYYFEERR